MTATVRHIPDPDLEDQLDQAIGDRDAAQATARRLDTERNDAIARATRAEQDRDQARADLEAARGRCQHLRRELDAMTRLHDQRHRDWQRADNARQQLLTERANLRADLQRDLDHARAAGDVYLQHYHQARTELTAATRDLDHARREYDAARAELTGIRQQLISAHTTIRALTDAPVPAPRAPEPDAVPTPGPDRIAQAIGDPGSVVGPRRLTWRDGGDVDGEHETVTRWATRAVLTVLAETAAAPAHDDQAPETYCHRCGRPNPTWTAPSPLWNAVMRGGSILGDEQHDGIVCPCCFAALAEQAGIATGWRLTAEQVTARLETVTPSGRVWDPDAWLWRDSTSAETPAAPAVDPAGARTAPAEGAGQDATLPDAPRAAEPGTACAQCGDHIWPGECLYDGHRCAICAAQHATEETPDA